MSSDRQLLSTLVRLGYDLDAKGFAGNEAAVRQVVGRARSAGVTGVAIEVLADTAAPDVARMRAFAAVSAALANPKAPRGELIGAA